MGGVLAAPLQHVLPLLDVQRHAVVGVEGQVEVEGVEGEDDGSDVGGWSRHGV